MARMVAPQVAPRGSGQPPDPRMLHNGADYSLLLKKPPPMALNRATRAVPSAVSAWAS